MSGKRPETLSELAECMRITPGVLTSLSYAADRHYRVFRIEKSRRGRYRTIFAPSSVLKGVQKWIARNILSEIRLGDCCIAFRKGVSILDGARRHTNRRFVLNIDLKNFFESINYRRVVSLFFSLGFSAEFAPLLANLTTVRGFVPQGAPSSPVIANLVLRRLDRRLLGLSENRRWIYTRYADDITFSSDRPFSRQSICFVASIIRSEGFAINQEKTRVSGIRSRQEVTGLTVNGGVSPSRRWRRRLRAQVHRFCVSPTDFSDELGRIVGSFAFWKMVQPSSGALGTLRSMITKAKS